MLKLIITTFLTCSALSLKATTYHSQIGQDKFLNEMVFKNKRNGVFIDIGAYDGVTGSNSLFFEKNLQWQGLCIEPVPAFYQRLKIARTATCINACIGENGTKDFLWIDGPDEQLSGLVDKFDTRQKALIDQMATSHGDRHTILQIQSLTLMDLLDRHDIKHVDYLSIDTEGGEFEIIQSIDFNKININAISVENNYDDPAFAVYLATKGYRKAARLIVDDIYVKE